VSITTNHAESNAHAMGLKTKEWYISLTCMPPLESATYDYEAKARVVLATIAPNNERRNMSSWPNDIEGHLATHSPLPLTLL